MRTNIDIDDDLMQAAMDVTGHKTKKDTVEEALRSLVRQRRAHQELMKLRGKIEWEGDLGEMRHNRHLPDGE